MKQNSFWLCAAVTVASALTSAGFSLAALSSSGDAHVNAMYAAARSLSVALVCLAVVLVRSRVGLITLSVIMVLVQGGDAVIGAINHDPMKTFGPAFLALVTVAVLLPLLRATPTKTTE